ncbi:Cryptochrome-1 [Balamuthia mandrillaris]
MLGQGSGEVPKRWSSQVEGQQQTPQPSSAVAASASSSTATAASSSSSPFIFAPPAPSPFPSAPSSTRKRGRSLVWFRKGLRLHDNPALLQALQDEPERVYPVFVIDPHFIQPQTVGLRRYNFMLESLRDLDKGLRGLRSRLLVLRGDPVQVLPVYFQRWKITRLTFERDTEPYAKVRDETIARLAREANVEVRCPTSHTLWDPDQLLALNGGRAPLTYQAFLGLIKRAGEPLSPVLTPTEPLPSYNPTPESDEGEEEEVIPDEDYSVPTLEELNYPPVPVSKPTPWHGGESEGLAMLERYLADKKKVATFDKPKGNPCKIKPPCTTTLSPYMKFGCVSCRTFFYALQAVYKTTESYTQPPVSLLGQLYWREFFYLVAYCTPNFDKMENNPICKQIPWRPDDEEFLAAWKECRTGYPWIDACMKQLNDWGWMHHLARHAVACFLTRGDLWVHWIKGRDVFDTLLLDADWSLNNANWLWLSASAFFTAYFRIYNPITFAQKYDREGKFVKHFLPVLKHFPREYVYEPWRAPLSVQRKAGCIIGRDYPFPIVEHSSVSRENKEKMKLAYNAGNHGYRSSPRSSNGTRKRARTPPDQATLEDGKAKSRHKLQQVNKKVHASKAKRKVQEETEAGEKKLPLKEKEKEDEDEEDGDGDGDDDDYEDDEDFLM